MKERHEIGRQPDKKAMTTWGKLKKQLEDKLEVFERKLEVFENKLKDHCYAKLFVEALQVPNKVYISSFPDQEMWAQDLSSRNIDFAISCVEPHEFEIGLRLRPKFYQDQKIQHLVVPLKRDQHGYIHRDQTLLSQCVDAVHQAKTAIEGQGKGSVLFHCGSGKGRVLTLLIATLALMPKYFNGEMSLCATLWKGEVNPKGMIKPKDDVKTKGKKIHQWLSYVHGHRLFDPFEKLEKDIIVIVDEYLKIHPATQDDFSMKADDHSVERERDGNQPDSKEHFTYGGGP